MHTAPSKPLRCFTPRLGALNRKQALHPSVGAGDPRRGAVLFALALALAACGDGAARIGDDGSTESTSSRGLGALDAQVVSADFPTRLDCGARATAKVVVLNSGSKTWTRDDGFKLGAAGDGDPLFRDDVRVLLPDGAAVRPGERVAFEIPLEAPSTPGPQVSDWQMVQEFVAWFGARVERTVDVTCGGGGPVTPPPPGGRVELCDGVLVDTSGYQSATAALQRCVDDAREGDALELPAGSYLMTEQLRVFKPLTLRTAGTAGQGGSCLAGVSCARLVADANLLVTNGFLAIGGSGVVLEHVVLDGNRGARLGSQAAGICAGGNNRVGFNATAQTCVDCGFVLSASINALCGSGFEWFGDGAQILGSSFRDNGDNARHMMWADGLTLLQSDGAAVLGNEFIDNSDIGFISGGARGATFRDNRVLQARQLAFGGVMLDNFNGYTHGDFEGTTLSNTQVECSAQQCDYGVVVGPHAWYPSANIRGGVVTGNTVRGAKLGLVVSGGGTSDAPVAIFGNSMSGSPSSARFLCGTRRSGNYVISPDSFVDTRGDATPFERFEVTNCP